MVNGEGHFDLNEIIFDHYFWGDVRYDERFEKTTHKYFKLSKEEQKKWKDKQKSRELLERIDTVRRLNESGFEYHFEVRKVI